ncbi:MAG: helix-hairpin-helix domain-containing protein [Bacteroidia bacterium]
MCFRIRNYTCKNFVEHRNHHGFQSRNDLLKIKGFGPAAFQQSSGFLRIPKAENPLDNSAVHPEHYNIVEQMASDSKMKGGAVYWKRKRHSAD